MFNFDYNLFINILRFCDGSHLFPLLLTSKEIKDLTWRYLIDFLEIDLNKFLIKDPSADSNQSIKAVSCCYHLEIVKLLLMK